MHQAGVTFGTAALYRTLIRLLRIANIRVVYAFAAYFIVPFVLVVSPGTKVAYHYFRRCRNYSKLRALWATYRNHCLFAETVIDKFASYAGHRFSLTLHGADSYEQLLAQPGAVIQLGAHIGCAEILGYNYPVSKTCNVLAYGGEKEALMDYREKAFEGMNMHIISVGTSSLHAEEIASAIDSGEVICTFADRVMNPRKTVGARLFGREVQLAKGPLNLAVRHGLPVIMVSAMKNHHGGYDAFFTPLAYDKQLSPAQQRQQLADAYTRETERLLEMYPLQWFNYFAI